MQETALIRDHEMVSTGSNATVKLPVEIWSRVFIFSVGDDDRSLQAIVCVNHTFRTIADTTPQLWTKITFDEEAHFTDLLRARRLLQKSGALPLQIDIDIPDLDPLGDTQPLAKLLREEVARFQTLKISTFTQHRLDTFLSEMGRDQPAPYLERINITCEGEDLQETDSNDLTGFQIEHDTLRTLFQPSPRLAHADLPAYLLPLDDSLPMLSTVHDLTIDANHFGDDPHIDRILNILPHVPLLRLFDYRGLCIASEDHHNARPFVSTPSLLSATVAAPGTGLDILCRLNAPNIRQICLTGGYMDPVDSSFTVCLRWLTQHMSSITVLELSDIVMHDPISVYPWLFSSEAFPALQVLALRDGDITDEVLQRCRPSTSLRRLELCTCGHVTLAGLLPFVEGCDKSFELLVHSCIHVPANDDTPLSNHVKVEYEHPRISWWHLPAD